jgi:hypothetical protein
MENLLTIRDTAVPGLALSTPRNVALCVFRGRGRDLILVTRALATHYAKVVPRRTGRTPADERKARGPRPAPPTVGRQVCLMPNPMDVDGRRCGGDQW